MSAPICPHATSSRDAQEPTPGLVPTISEETVIATTPYAKPKGSIKSGLEASLGEVPLVRQAESHTPTSMTADHSIAEGLSDSPNDNGLSSDNQVPQSVTHDESPQGERLETASVGVVATNPELDRRFLILHSLGVWGCMVISVLSVFVFLIIGFLVLLWAGKFSNIKDATVFRRKIIPTN
ncbi:hypothetical protein F5B20DRAFT_565617 [Whalleya microplaca]|nr:hypothetical protein F5B20DRAFT_565617 [Whalleya microplaca]